MNYIETRRGNRYIVWHEIRQFELISVCTARALEKAYQFCSVLVREPNRTIFIVFIQFVGSILRYCVNVCE